MTITRRQIRRELYNQVPGLGFSGTADSLTGATLTDTNVFTDSTLAQGHFRGMYLYRPDRTGDDIVHRITTFNSTTGIVTTVSSYSNTSDTVYEVVGLLHPDELNACILRAQQRIYFETQIVLPGEVTDGDMEAATTASWTASSANITLSKNTTNVFSGTYSLRGVQVSAGEYAYSASLRVEGGEPIFASTVVRAATGTAVFTVYDTTNSAIVGQAATTTEDVWQHLFVKTAVPSTCQRVILRLAGIENNADCYWDHAILYRTNQTMLPAPSWLDEQHKLLKLREARYVAGSNANSTNANDATSRRWEDWYQPSMYSLDPFRLETNPYMIQCVRGLPSHELWLNAKRPYSDVEPLSSADTDTTHAPERQVYAYAKQELAKVLGRRYPSDGRWKVLLAEADLEVAAETQARPETPLQPKRREEWLGYV